MIMANIKCLCAVATLFPLTVFGWNLATVDDAGLSYITNNDDYAVVHVSVFYVRAFLTLRGRRNSTKHQITVIESTWPENLLPIQSRIFPNDLSHAKTTCDCNGILQTVQTAVDRSNGMLWLLDNGSIYCPPKLIVFDLLRGNSEVHRYVFNKFKSNSFKSIHLQHKTEETNDITLSPQSSFASTTTSCRAFITVHNEKFIILYSLHEKRPHKLFLIVSPPAFGKVLSGTLIPHQLTVKNDDELLISDRTNSMWVANLNKVKLLRHGRRNDNGLELYVEVKCLGSLLGAAKSMVVPAIANADAFNNFLYYYVPRDGAILRWNLRQPLTAEAHEVLYFAHARIVQIVFGAKGSVWIVREQSDEFGDHCRRISNFFTSTGGRFVL